MRIGFFQMLFFSPFLFLLNRGEFSRASSNGAATQTRQRCSPVGWSARATNQSCVQLWCVAHGCDGKDRNKLAQRKIRSGRCLIELQVLAVNQWAGLQRYVSTCNRNQLELQLMSINVVPRLCCHVWIPLKTPASASSAHQDIPLLCCSPFYLHLCCLPASAFVSPRASRKSVVAFEAHLKPLFFFLCMLFFFSPAVLRLQMSGVWLSVCQAN